MSAYLDQTRAPSPADLAGPFTLDDEGCYRLWRSARLEARASQPAAAPVVVANARALSTREREALRGHCAAHNLAVYQHRAEMTPADLLAFGRQLGLCRLDGNPLAPLDGVAVIRTSHSGRDREFIPYTDRALNWHTDGYYNVAQRPVRGVIMHCVSQAARGGDTALLDPEIAYIRLRDRNPEFIRALMAADALTIPAWVENAVELRPARVGPVFSVDPGSGCLHMRYTIRKRHVLWKNDPVTGEARAFLERLLGAPGDDAIRIRLAPGQGIVCNNVLHNRAAFVDAHGERAPRTLLRARYLDRAGEGGC